MMKGSINQEGMITLNMNNKNNTARGVIPLWIKTPQMKNNTAQNIFFFSKFKYAFIDKSRKVAAKYHLM